jgi:hypothetical protein
MVEGTGGCEGGVLRIVQIPGFWTGLSFEKENEQPGERRVG